MWPVYGSANTVARWSACISVSFGGGRRACRAARARRRSARRRCRRCAAARVSRAWHKCAAGSAVCSQCSNRCRVSFFRDCLTQSRTTTVTVKTATCSAVRREMAFSDAEPVRAGGGAERPRYGDGTCADAFAAVAHRAHAGRGHLRPGRARHEHPRRSAGHENDPLGARV